MENFIATDNEQFDVIKRIIDLCDYYVLIIGGRYGSVNAATGKSYTEMEYDYAIEKGIPVLAFAIDDIKNLPDDKKDSNDLYKAKLTVFREKALKNRLAGIWGNKDELAYKVFAALVNAKQEFDRPGWVRGGEYDEKTLLEKICTLNDENQKLKEEIEKRKLASKDIFDDVAYKQKIKLHFQENIFIYYSGMQLGEKDIELSYEEIFKQVSLSFLTEGTQKDFENAVNNLVSGYHTSTKTILKIKAQFLILGLIALRKEKKGKEDVELISLTTLGLSEMKRLNAA